MPMKSTGPSTPPGPANSEQNLPSDADPRASLILKLGRALQELGAPAHRLEAAMELVADKLGLAGQFFSSPTGLFAALGDGNRQHTYMIRAKNGDINLAKLSDINDVMVALSRDEVSVETALERVQRITDRPDTGHPLAVATAFAFTSAAVSIFLGGGWADLLASGAVGLVLGMLAVLAQRYVSIARAFEPLSAFLAALLAWLIAARTGLTHMQLNTLAGLIILIPGLTFTVAVRELATGQLVSGSSRMAGAMVLFMTLGLGVWAGGEAGLALAGPIQTPPMQPLPEWLIYLALFPVSYGFVVLFKAHRRDFFWILLACYVSVFGLKLGHLWMDEKMAVSFAAFLVGCSGNLFSRLTLRTSSLLQMPGLMLLVPGSVGFKGLTAMLHNNVLEGIQIAFNAGITAVALTTGLLLASIVIPPKRDL